MNLDERIRSLLEAIARAMLRRESGVEVRVLDGQRATRFEIHVPAEDRGQLIGKEGMTVRSLRALVGLSAKRHRRRFEVEIPG